MSQQEIAESILVIGIGNEFRNDDGAGIFVSKLIRARNLPGVKTLDQSGEGAELMESWAGFKTLFLVDAVSSLSNSGTIHRIDTRIQSVPLKFFNCSSHAFGIAESIELSKILGTLPERCSLFGIEGKDFGWGRMLSAEVERAAEQVVETIISEIGPTCLCTQSIGSEDQRRMNRQYSTGEASI